MSKAKKNIQQTQLAMFDLNGADKLSLDTVEQREAIIAHYAKDPKALFFCSLSGGKDGQAMAVILRNLVPAKQIIYIHANLGDSVEHPGVLEHLKSTLPEGSEFYEVKNERKDFIDMVLLRGMFPSAAYRQCTSDLKTSQIDKAIRRLCKEKGASVGFNVIGLRSEESVPRSKRFPLIVNERLTLKSGKRVVYDYLPAFHLTEQNVFDTICEAGQEPFHIYGIRNINNKAVRVAKGNKRVSCRYCILAGEQDLTNAANWYGSVATNGEHTEYELMIALERVTGHTMFFKSVKKEAVLVSLADKTGVPVDEVAVRRWMMILSERRNQLLEEKRIEMERKSAVKAEREASINANRIDKHTIAMF